MHSHVRGCHRAKFDDNDFNSFRRIACEGHTHRDGLVYVNFFQILKTLKTKKNTTQHDHYCTEKRAGTSSAQQSMLKTKTHLFTQHMILSCISNKHKSTPSQCNVMCNNCTINIRLSKREREKETADKKKVLISNTKKHTCRKQTKIQINRKRCLCKTHHR